LIRIQALLGVLGISFSAIFLRLSGVSPVTAAFFRGFYALPVLVCLWLMTRASDTRPRASRIRAACSGIFLALDLALWHQAVLDIGAGLATVLINAQVMFVAGLAWALHRERPSRPATVLIPIVLAGVVLISGLGRADAYGANPVSGVIFAVAAAALYAVFQLLFRESNRALAPPAGPVLDVTIGMTVGSLLLAAPFDPRFSVAFSWPAHGWLIVMAIICQALAWILLGIALPRLPALETSVILLSQPMGTVVWGWLILNERMSAIQAAGMVVMTVGIALLLVMGTVTNQTPPSTRRSEEALVGS
jgi:drug/metabolite transporter (DMT)-like permease